MAKSLPKKEKKKKKKTPKPFYKSNGKQSGQKAMYNQQLINLPGEPLSRGF